MSLQVSENKQQFLSGGGDMGERIRRYDWSKTPLGDPAHWEQSLKTCVRIMLSSSQPIWIGWGNDLIKLYNDPYKAIVGGKHPWALGQPASKVWSDIWNDIEPMLKQVMEKDEGTYAESQLLIMERNNYPEETYYTFSYTPIPGDKGGTAGMICANTDDTNRIVNERALRTLRDLGKLRYSEKSIQHIYIKAAQVLADNNKDFPSAVFYEVDEQKMTAKAVAWAGNKEDYHNYPQLINIEVEDSSPLPVNISKAIRENQVMISETADHSPEAPKGFWPVASRQFIAVPLTLSGKVPTAVLSIGLNPFRQFDKTYSQFIQLLADQLILEMNSMQALENERKRSQALAEIDKAKTVFFNNISHEFRTPLTLMLGPLEELMQQPSLKESPQNLSTIEAAHRNAMRLLKLVNTLLDFSRIESGRQQANFTLVNAGSYTKDLASNFRAVIEKAGLQLIVNVEKQLTPVQLDKQMWEKIVFNLLSNAFKYTLTGGITVSVFSQQQQLVLQVADTGIGIPEKELPFMFQRFHRVTGASGRTYEGSGIGLSMIKELVALHSGTISVESKEGSGSVFTVSIPFATEGVDPVHVTPPENSVEELMSDFYLQEAAALVDIQDPVEQTAREPRNENGNGKLPAILVVDDNADMRDYIQSLLEKNYTVVPAKNGQDALQKIERELPSLILSDIMMPVMDGIQLLQKVKENPATANIPVILLSARAGEESKIEGYEIGADDYLIKPFSAKELLARIRSQLKITHTRKHTEQQLKNLFLQAPVAICIFRGPTHIIEVANEKMLELWGRTAAQVLNKPVWEAVPSAKDQGFEQLLDDVYKTGKRFVANELPLSLYRKGRQEDIFVKFVYEPLYDEDGNISGVMALADEITEQVNARQVIERSEADLRNMVLQAPIGICILDAQTLVSQIVNESFVEVAGKPYEEIAGRHYWETFAEVKEGYEQALNDVIKYGTIFQASEAELLLERHGRMEKVYVTFVYAPMKNEEGIVNKVAVWVLENTQQVLARQKIEESETRYRLLSNSLETLVEQRTGELNQKNSALEKMNQELQSFAYISSHDLQEPLRKIQTFSSQIVQTELMNLSEKGRDKFERMQNSAKRMQVLIEDLLAYSRTNTQERKFEKTSLRKLVSSVLDDMQEEIQLKKATVGVDVSGTVDIIPFQFIQLLYNLISNSLKFSDASRLPHIKIESAILSGKSIAGLQTDPQKDYLRLRVSDNGIGFEQEYNERIFNVFQRLHGRTDYAGTGIGLAIVKKIVENHGGTIKATGKINEGAEFEMLFPLAIGETN